MKAKAGFFLLLIFSPLSAADFKTVDAELNRVYGEILALYKDDPVFIARLKASEKAWLKFRDAQLEAMYPNPITDHTYTYGSVYPTCASNLLTELTEERIKQLRVWLDGTVEGDVCRGSVRVKEAR